VGKFGECPLTDDRENALTKTKQKNNNKVNKKATEIMRDK